MSKRALVKLLHQVQIKVYKRGQLLFKEGDSPDFLYIVKEGQLQVSRNVYQSKSSSQYEHDLLTKNTRITRRYNTNFSRALGTKFDFEVPLAIQSVSSMVGDIEIVKQEPRRVSVRCDSQTATIWRVRREDMEKVRQVSEENWKDFCKVSEQLATSQLQAYVTKVKSNLTYRRAGSSKENGSTSQFCHQIMKEMLWD